MRLEAVLPPFLPPNRGILAAALSLGGPRPIHPRIPRMLADQRRTEEEEQEGREKKKEEEEEVGENGDRPHGPLIAFHTHTLHSSRRNP